MLYRRGSLLLENVELDAASFDAVGLPVTITGGKVGRLEVSGVWSNVLSGTPVKVELQDVEVSPPPPLFPPITHGMTRHALR